MEDGEFDDDLTLDVEGGPVNERAVLVEAAEADAEADSADADFEWDDEESDALRQALVASAGSVRAYIRQIGKVPLLNEEQEIDLAKRMEAGLFASERLRIADEEGEVLPPALRRDLDWISRDGERPRTTCSRRTFGWWSASQSGTPGGAWSCWT